jgi:uncharacterized radical SAM superfamily Fe-S cluster-containing enzyme
MKPPGSMSHLGTTRSTCRLCRRLIPAHVVARDDGVWLEKVCPEHGPQTARVHGDAAGYLGLGRFHRRASTPLAFATEFGGCPDSCGLCPEHEQHVCLPILEITDHCNLECPICLVTNPGTRHLSRADVAWILDGLIRSEGQIDVLNLSGGEPTLNPTFREIVEECVARKEILRVSVSTNGLVLARDAELLRFLADRRVIVSLQFDGLSDDVYRALRGRPLREEKLRLIDQCAELDAAMSLTATVVRGVNDDRVSEVAEMLFAHRHILSAMFQPAAYAGQAANFRAPVSGSSRGDEAHLNAECGTRNAESGWSPLTSAATATERSGRPAGAVTIPDVIRALNGAAGGTVSASDFSPLPCSHPACFALAFYLEVEEKTYRPIKPMIDAARYLDLIQNRALFGTDADSFARIKDAVYELWSGPAALSPDSQKALSAIRRLLAEATAGGYSAQRAVAVAERSVKSIFIHQFMDPDTFDLSRARKCCQVYPQPDGRLIPACVRNCLKAP